MIQQFDCRDLCRLRHEQSLVIGQLCFRYGVRQDREYGGIGRREWAVERIEAGRERVEVRTLPPPPLASLPVSWSRSTASCVVRAGLAFRPP